MKCLQFVVKIFPIYGSSIGMNTVLFLFGNTSANSGSLLIFFWGGGAGLPYVPLLPRHSLLLGLA